MELSGCARFNVIVVADALRTEKAEKANSAMLQTTTLKEHFIRRPPRKSHRNNADSGEDENTKHLQMFNRTRKTNFPLSRADGVHPTNRKGIVKKKPVFFGTIFQGRWRPELLQDR
jgi:hypothetical protein